MTDMDKIIAGLIHRTEDGTLKWKPDFTTPSGDEFTVSVDSISVELRRLDPDGFTPLDRYQLAIRDDEGPMVEILETADKFGLVANDQRATDEQARQMASLFALARRSALNTQATLEKLAKALGAE